MLTSTRERARSSTRRSTAVQLAALRAALLEQRRFRVEQLEDLTDAWHECGRSDGPRGEVVAVVHAAALKALADVDAALGRMDRRSYGCCLDCGTPIPLQRLEVLPMVERCMACQRRHELGAPEPDRAAAVVPAHRS